MDILTDRYYSRKATPVLSALLLFDLLDLFSTSHTFFSTCAGLCTSL